MQSLPRAVAQYYTDGKSFLHIAAWQGRKVSAHSVTLLSGGCLVTPAAEYADFAGALAAAGPDGCNARSATNATLIPTLRADGSLRTPAPLLVLVSTNVSLGFGLKPGSIAIHRPVFMAGLYSVPTSVDMYMVVNQLNATSQYAKMHFLSLFIENAVRNQLARSSRRSWQLRSHDRFVHACCQPQAASLTAARHEPLLRRFELTAQHHCCCCVVSNVFLSAGVGRCRQQLAVAPHELSRVSQCVCCVLRPLEELPQPAQQHRCACLTAGDGFPELHVVSGLRLRGALC